MKKILFVILSFIVSSVHANNLLGEGSIKGSVFDAEANLPLQYATISILNPENDSIIDGTITGHTGSFKIKNIQPGNYRVNVSFIGYKTTVVDDVVVNNSMSNVDLGKIILTAKTENLDEVKVKADQSPVSFKIDRKVIHVNQQDINSSGTAINVLENYPSVTVDIDGTVNLRGSSSFTVLVDNKPTVLDPSDVLNQIPANTIQSIEIITNPTAKYNSEGTSGIINVILKKNKLQGVSGLLQTNGGMYKNYGGDFLINLKREKTNFYIDLNVNNRGIEGNLENTSRSSYLDTVFYVISNGNYDRIKGSKSARGGIDFQFNPNNTINLEAIAGKWISGGTTKLDYQYYTNPASLNNKYLSKEEPSREGNFYNLDLKYTHDFSKKGHQVSSLFYFDRRDLVDETDNNLSDYSNNLISGKKSIESGPFDSYDFQIDYTLPLKSKQKFEAGYKADISNYNKHSEIYQYNANILDYELDSSYLYDVKFNKNIHALYSVYAGTFNKLGYQFGVRAEYTNRRIKQSTATNSNTIDRIDYFPTVHFSYSLNENRQLMLSYTRRISRPKDWQLELFYTWKDAYNLRLGNPGLKPEYIDSYELNFITKWKRNSISVDVYYRLTHNSIETIQNIYDENIYLLTYSNADNNNALGTELTFNMVLLKWWRCYLSGNLYNKRLKGTINNEAYDKQSLSWNARMYNTFTLGKTTRLQLSLRYNSPYVTVQGDNQGYFMANASVRQEVFKDFSATLQVVGVFGLLERSKTFESDDLYIHNYIEPHTPIVSLSISYKIRNYKNNRRHKNLDMDNGEDGL